MRVHEQRRCGPEGPGSLARRQELERQIEETPAELAGTVEALAHKADVKARAKEKADDLAVRAKATAGQLSDSAPGRHAGAIGLGVVVVALIAWLVARRRS